MIPQKIHYIWLGGGQKPKSFVNTYKTWQVCAADFELIEWNESHIHEFNLPPYFNEAMKQRRFAFASDVLRAFILERDGGIYIDIDQELLKPINILLDNSFFIGLYHEVDDYYGCGFIGAIPNHYIIKELIKNYTAWDVTQDGFIIINALLSRIVNTYKNTDTSIHIYEQELFYPVPSFGHDIKNAYARHLAHTSWIPWWNKIINKIPMAIRVKQIIKKVLPQSIKKRLKTDVTYL